MIKGNLDFLQLHLILIIFNTVKNRYLEVGKKRDYDDVFDLAFENFEKMIGNTNETLRNLYI